jgi:hypothetical protein
MGDVTVLLVRRPRDLRPGGRHTLPATKRPGVRVVEPARPEEPASAHRAAAIEHELVCRNLALAIYG